MKNPFKTPSKWNAYILALAIGLSACNGDHQKTASHSGADTNSAAPTNTNAAKAAVVPAVLTLSLCEYVVAPAEANTQYLNAFAKIRKTKTLPLDFTFDKITDTMVNDWNTSIIANHPAGHGCAGFVPAMIVTPGLEGNTLRFLYQTCYVCTNAYTENASAAFTVFAISSSYSVVSSGAFVAYANATARITEYTTSIKFKEGAVWRNFDEPTAGDTRSILIPLQKITSVMAANTVTAVYLNHFSIVDGGKTRQSTVFGAADHPLKDLNKLLQEKSFDGTHYFLSGEFNGKFADRSHLCPPNCSQLNMIVCSDATKNCQN